MSAIVSTVPCHRRGSSPPTRPSSNWIRRSRCNRTVNTLGCCCRSSPVGTLESDACGFGLLWQGASRRRDPAPCPLFRSGLAAHPSVQGDERREGAPQSSPAWRISGARKLPFSGQLYSSGHPTSFKKTASTELACKRCLHADLKGVAKPHLVHCAAPTCGLSCTTMSPSAQARGRRQQCDAAWRGGAMGRVAPRG